MAKSLNLQPEHFQRKPKMPAIIKPREIQDIPGVKGQFPLRAGEIVLTPEESARLRSFGWQPGDPIPGNLPDYIKAFDQATRSLPEEVREEIRTTPSAPPGTPPTKIPQPVDISQLDAQHRAEIEAYLQDFRKHAPEIEKAVKVRSGMDKIAPSIQQAIVAHEQEGVELVDSRTEKEFVDQALGTQFGSAEDLQKQIDIAEGKKKSRNVVETEPEAASEVEDPLDYVDKAGYLTAIMAMKPFRKLYTLFGGRIEIVFRQLDTELAEMVLTQVSHSARVGLVEHEENIQLGHVYWSLLSLESISFQGEKTNVAEAVNDYLEAWDKDASEDGEPTPLPSLLKTMRASVPLHHVSVWRAVQKLHAKFNKLVEALEAKSDEPDFWNGIAV
jgi:hypothetical protein